MKNIPAFGREESMPASQVPTETEAGPQTDSLQFAPEARTSVPVWLQRTGCLALSVLVTGTAALYAEPAEAKKGYAERIPPVVTHPRKTGNHDTGLVIANVPYGYYIGRAFVRSKVKEVLATKAKDYTGSAITQTKGSQTIIQCGWLESESLSPSTHQVEGPLPCDKQLEGLTNQYEFGHGFNCAPGVCDGGTFATHLTPECDDKLYANDASLDAAIANVSSLRSSHKARGLYDYIGKLDNSEPVHYRYTTNDNKAAVIMSNEYGWGFISKSCVAGYPQGGGLKAVTSTRQKSECLGEARHHRRIGAKAIRETSECRGATRSRISTR